MPDNAMFTLVPIFIRLIGLVILGGIMVAVIRAIQRQAANKASPQLARQARVTAKRSDLTGTSDHRSNTYYATFEFPDGSREEFRLQGDAYGLLSEGDSGLLRTQGTWFQGFDRNSQIQDRRN